MGALESIGNLFKYDVITVVKVNPDNKKMDKSENGKKIILSGKDVRIISSRENFLNDVGFVPFVGGLVRIGLAVFYLFANLGYAIKGDTKKHLSEAKVGLIEIGRGCVEIIPGGAFIFSKNESKLSLTAETWARDEFLEYSNLIANETHSFVFSDGKFIGLFKGEHQYQTDYAHDLGIPFTGTDDEKKLEFIETSHKKSIE